MPVKEGGTPVGKHICLLLLAKPRHHDVQGQGGDEGIVLDLLAVLQSDNLSILVNACDKVAGTISLVLLGKQLGDTLPDRSSTTLHGEPAYMCDRVKDWQHESDC